MNRAIENWRRRALKGRLVTIYQYGNSKPSTDEEEAFMNWFEDTFGVKK